MQASGGEPIGEANVATQAALSVKIKDHHALRKGVPVPSLATVKDFFGWLVYGSKRMLAKHTTIYLFFASSRQELGRLHLLHWKTVTKYYARELVSA